MFDGETDFEGMGDAEIEAAIKAEAETQEKTVSLDKIRAAQICYEVMPENCRLELLDTKHPNQTMPDFIKFLASRSAASFGLSEQFATLQVDGASYRANQIFSQRTFEECQKFLEQILDWIFYRWSVWATRKGIITPAAEMKSGRGFLRKVDWAWGRLSQLDEVAHANAMEKQLATMTTSYRQIYGSDWKERLAEIRDEIAYFKANGLAHPSFNMISGGERSEAAKPT